MTKTIFITGASSGLGKETAKLFASNGWKVIATMRKPEIETELSKISNITLMRLDVTDDAQIKETIQKAIELGVDVVFNNAGFGLYGPVEAISEEQIERQFKTNVFGVIKVAQAFIPYFKHKKQGMFITTTSIGAHTAYPLGSIYHATKWALEGWTESVSFELKQFGIKIKNIIPGLMKTEFNDRSFEYVSHPDYKAIFEKLFGTFNPADYPSPTIAANFVYEAATDGKDQFRYFAGEDAKAIFERRREIGDEASKKEIEQFFIG